MNYALICIGYKYLSSGREAGELDWKAIGGTWGIATSRLIDWKRTPDGFYPQYFKKLLTDIAHGHHKNGQALSNYVAKYFEDIWQHLSQVHRIMKYGGEVHYIIGNSTFYGIVVPVETLYKDMLEAYGFRNVSINYTSAKFCLPTQFFPSLPPRLCGHLQQVFHSSWSFSHSACGGH